MARVAAFCGCAWLIFACSERGEVLGLANPASGGSSALAVYDVSASTEHGCALNAGVLYCFGDNAEGQLGADQPQSSATPLLVSSSGTFRRVVTGEHHSCALDDLGQVYCWGGNDRGQLGLGDRVSRAAPSLVPLPGGALSISSKFAHTCALLRNAALYCWGQNWEGQLGQGDPPPSSETMADGLSPLPIGAAEWRSVDAGDGHTCAIRLDGKLYCWGRNSEHELGGDSRIQVREPVLVTLDGPWLEASAGQSYSCAIREDFTLWCWGDNTGSQRGEGYPLGIADVDQLDMPGRVVDARGWLTLRANTFHTCAINRQAELWCWGRNTEGQLGLGDLEARQLPLRVSSAIAFATVGRFSTCAVTASGAVACTGKNESGQLGTGDRERRNTLTALVFPAP